MWLDLNLPIDRVMFNDWTDYIYHEERQANDDSYTGWMEKVFEPSFPMDRRHSDGKKIQRKFRKEKS